MQRAARGLLVCRLLSLYWLILYWHAAPNPSMESLSEIDVTEREAADKSTER